MTADIVKFSYYKTTFLTTLNQEVNIYIASHIYENIPEFNNIVAEYLNEAILVRVFDRIAGINLFNVEAKDANFYIYFFDRIYMNGKFYDPLDIENKKFKLAIPFVLSSNKYEKAFKSILYVLDEIGIESTTPFDYRMGNLDFIDKMAIMLNEEGSEK